MIAALNKTVCVCLGSGACECAQKQQLKRRLAKQQQQRVPERHTETRATRATAVAGQRFGVHVQQEVAAAMR
jgi:hypothetical protein